MPSSAAETEEGMLAPSPSGRELGKRPGPASSLGLKGTVRRSQNQGSGARPGLWATMWPRVLQQHRMRDTAFSHFFFL